MKKIWMIGLIFLALEAGAQHSSAEELAEDQAKKFLNEKMFRDLNYKPVSFQGLQEFSSSNKEIRWSLKHECHTLATRDEDSESRLTRTVVLFFDRYMNVIEAVESYTDKGMELPD